MFQAIFKFELKYRFNRPATYLYFVIFTLVGLLYGAIMGGAFGSEVAVTITGGGKNLANSPYNIMVITGAVGQLGIFVVAAFMGVPVYRDFEHKTFPLFFTKPISKWHYLGGRFFGSLLISALVLLSISLGLILSQWLPAVNTEKYGVFNLWYYLHPYFLVTLPFTVFTGSIFFATVSLTRNQLFIYLNAIVVLVLIFAASYLSGQIDNKTLSSLIDPTGLTAIAKSTELWTVTERNNQVIPLTSLIIINRLIWVGVGLIILLLTYVRFSFTFVGKGRIKQAPRKVSKTLTDTLTIQKIRLPKVRQDFSQTYQFGLLRMLIKKEFFQVLYNPIFLVITVVGLLFMVLGVTTSGKIFETPVLPVTYRILDILSGSFRMFILAIIVFYSGEMVWAERQYKVSLMYDALPIPNWLPFTAKFFAMIGIELFLLTVIMLMGMLVQAGNGYYHFEPLLYIKHLYGVQMLDLLLVTILTFTIHIVVNNKYFGFFAVVLVYFFFSTILPYLGVTHKLLLFKSAPMMLYSDLNGYGHFLQGWLAFKTYWLAFGLILLVFANGLWLRGTDSHWRARWRKTLHNFTPVAKLALGVATLAFVAMGGYIFYNTNILNDFVTQEEENTLRASYEKKYKKYDTMPQPKVIDVQLEVDLYPYKRILKAKGHYVLKNKTETAIQNIHINTSNDAVVQKMKFGKAFREIQNDQTLAYAIYKLNKPLEPQQTITLDFEISYAYKGFGNSSANNFLTYNGTFVNEQIFPKIGYQPLGELTSDDVRKKHGLEPHQRFPRINNLEARKNNALSNDADWINFEIKLSTAPDQIAIAPGYLQKEWKKNGRRYFHYKMDKPILNFYSILSARYAVKKDVWTSKEGKKVNLEIYYHPTHTYNLERMMQGMKKSLSYCSANFSPYQYRQMRILEFPRYAGFAQSFANTVPYSESIGFLADVDDKKDIDLVLYVTAHEVAHQWWGHQVVPAYVQGAHTVIESMAQYSALMTMEKALGKDKIKKFLRLEMNKYLKGRSAEIQKEMPLMLTEGQQYIHYNKGSVVLYALQDYIGEKQMNAALQKYVKQVAYKEAPYTTALEWVSFLREATPDSLQYLITDMFEKITLYENKVNSVSYQKKGDKYEVTLDIVAKKVQSDGYGVEKEVALNDYIDIGIFARKQTLSGKGSNTKVRRSNTNKVLYLKKHKITQTTQTIKVLVDDKPHSGGIDPYNKLIDRKPVDNTMLFDKTGKLKTVKK
ncbi:ABC transporter permease/M1 family aminopeptidase [Microscilla marina]|uniref:Membrane protein, putative n=1 Tax=Microscilla marina ATCC 23134 TaxID=313606 RepID=A1ZY16_MICM2|nr:M1 family aminopeptidase [Microscilla marina]EAY24753.1 membrane protein, putative [Microscilla marina ATCC 23134]